MIATASRTPSRQSTASTTTPITAGTETIWTNSVDRLEIAVAAVVTLLPTTVATDITDTDDRTYRYILDLALAGAQSRLPSSRKT
jgi:hypothetical protein